MKKLFGITAAIVTPMTAAGEIDRKGIQILTSFLIEKGIHCLYPCGTTGEMLRLSVEERERIAEIVLETASGKVPVYIHCGAARQDDTLRLLRHAQQAGADGAGIVTPQFFGINEQEMESYYVNLAELVPDFPLYLYNIPQCSANDLSAETASRIAARCPNVIGVKYSYADINRTIDYLQIQNGAFSVLHGCDRALPAFLALGCDGTVSGVAGVFPELFVCVYEAFQAGSLGEMQRLQKHCIAACDILKCGSNMSYFKEALKLRGIPAGHMRLPQQDLPNAETALLKTRLDALCRDAQIQLSMT
ncbi:dihydrodipicolinate synthase family protein [Diplocloster hominis]|uniref:dihydrodipicolinate synthase family protein n=1 Tax=Diplocloster hominis TaxID=3079010 RepID=UPI0031BAD442